MVKTCSDCTYENSDSLENCEICGAHLKASKSMFQKLADGIIKENRIKKNYLEANENIPELFIMADMLYVMIEINGVPIKAFIDTGAQVSIMTEECVKKCNLEDIVDDKRKFMLKGVGQQESVGHIYMADVMMAEHVVPCSFTVIKDMKDEVIIGINTMRAHGAVIDLANNCLMMSGVKFDFIN